MDRIVVIGAGQAGASLVAKLRVLGFAGHITLIGQEPFPPYQRPPLSKAYLLGQMERERLFLRPEEFYRDQKIDLRLGARVTGIDTNTRAVTVDGETLAFDALVLTTGATPNRLPAAIGGTLGGVHVVRGLADIDQVAPEFSEGRRVLIVGGGYIGLEAAAVAAQKGLKVTLVEMGARILQRVASPQTSDYFRELHRAHGVDIREGTGLKTLTGTGRVSGAELTDGTRLEVDFVIAGIGVQPASALAETAGLALDNGIRVDEMGRSSDPHIWAAGDCASFPWKGERIRLESVPNAIDQAEAVAANLLGANSPYIAKPWFWSDQFAVKLQMAGLNTGYDDVVERPGAKQGAVSFWYFQNDILLAVEAMNEPRAYMVGKRLIESGKSPDKAALANPETDLKSLM